MDVFNYYISENTVVFKDTLTTEKPYYAKTPRNHESLFFVTNGTMGYEKNGETVIIDKGCAGYVKKGSIDKSFPFNCESVSYIAVNFNKNGNFPSLPFKTNCGIKKSAEYEELFNLANKIYSLKKPGYIAVCNGIILQITGLIYEEENQSKEGLEKYNKIKNGIDFLTKNFNLQELEICKIAEKCNMSPKNFRRIFFELYHKMPYEYLIELRLSKAKIYLDNSPKSISDIAFECGFSDVYSFSHSFKKHFKISPNKYRKK